MAQTSSRKPAQSLTAPERPIERGHGPRGPDRRRRPKCAAPTRTIPRALARGPCRAAPMRRCRRRQHPLLRAHRETIERKRRGGSRRAERSSERTASRCGASDFEPAHQHIEQAFALGLLGHVAEIGRKHGAVGRLDVSGKDRERRGEIRRAIAQAKRRLVRRCRQIRSPRIAFQPKARERPRRSCRDLPAVWTARPAAGRVDFRAGLRAMAELLDKQLATATPAITPV